MVRMQQHPSPLAGDAPLGGQRAVPGRRSATVSLLAAAALATAALDQITKAAAVDALGAGAAHFGILHLRLVANRGLLMGMVQAPLGAVALATLLVVLTAVRAGRGNGPRVSIAFALLAGGALGNFADRLAERPNFPARAVVDWISFGGMTFNLADVALFIGALLLIAGPAPTRQDPDPRHGARRSSILLSSNERARS